MPRSPQPPVLLLERARVETEPTVDVHALTRPPDPGAAAALPEPSVTASPGSLFRAPGLALLAAVSVLEGYRWIGVIANRASRPWAMAFAVVAVVVALALTARDGRRRRTLVQRLVVILAMAVAVATVVVLWNDEGWAEDASGVVDLALASTALVALVAGERSRRRGDGAP